MKKPYEPGERVAVYDRNLRIVGTVLKSDGVYVTVAVRGVPWATLHRNQCRRLIPKKRREWWLVQYRDGERWVLLQDPPIGMFSEAVKVREVRK